jgi:hypothetical protein
MRRSGTGWYAPWVLLLHSGCGEGLDLGSYLVWYADHEAGDLSEWEALESGAGPTGVGESSDEQARSGSYSLRLASAAGDDSAIGAGFDFNERAEAYFSAWFYIPEVHQTDLDWSIFRFWSRGDGCTGPGGLCQGVDVNLRPLPNGDAVVYLFNAEPDVLQTPVSDPPLYVPVARWFHVEVLFRRSTGRDGRVWVWFDGKPLYRFENWRTAESDNLFWSVSNTLAPREGGTSVIYVDDAAISAVPVTPDGQLR